MSSKWSGVWNSAPMQTLHNSAVCLPKKQAGPQTKTHSDTRMREALNAHMLQFSRHCDTAGGNPRQTICLIAFTALLSRHWHDRLWVITPALKKKYCVRPTFWATGRLSLVALAFIETLFSNYEYTVLKRVFCLVNCMRNCVLFVSLSS